MWSHMFNCRFPFGRKYNLKGSALSGWRNNEHFLLEKVFQNIFSERLYKSPFPEL